VKPSLKLELQKELAAPELRSALGGFPLGPAERSLEFEYKGRKVISFASWDLLGLGTRRDILSPFVQTAEKHGLLPFSSRLFGGHSPEVARCEVRIAQFLGAEAAVLFPTRNQVVLSAITTLFNEADIIFVPSLSQTPIADACALVGAECHYYDQLDQLVILEKSRLKRRICIFHETVNSATGDGLAIEEVLRVADIVGAWVLTDESVAFGTFGLRGAGSADSLLWSPSLLGRIISFGLLGGYPGAAIAGSFDFKELLESRSRYLRYEVGESPASAAGITTLINAVEGAVVVRERLRTRAKLLFSQISQQGWRVSGGGESPILSIRLDSFRDALSLSEALLQRGLLLEPLPLKSRGREGGAVRVLLTINHSEAALERLLEALAVIRKRIISAESE
jgi:7-keto-8-aminopelargonate synthetase-like enzyme